MNITDYWLKHYTNNGHCGICGNKGSFDTTGIKTPMGHEVGRKFWCICPNGQALRKATKTKGPEKINRRIA